MITGYPLSRLATACDETPAAPRTPAPSAPSANAGKDDSFTTASTLALPYMQLSSLLNAMEGRRAEANLTCLAGPRSYIVAHSATGGRMKFISTRDVRNNPSIFREVVEEDDVVLTVNGKPFAIAVGTDEDELEETLDLLRQVRALRAMSRMQRGAAERSVSGLSMEEVNAEIRAARKARRGPG